MKKLHFNFDHPFKGRASLLQLDSPNPKKHVFLIENDGNFVVPTTLCKPGSWKLILDWQHDKCTYTFQEKFKV